MDECPPLWIREDGRDALDRTFPRRAVERIAGGESLSSIRPALKEPAEQALAPELESRAPVIRAGAARPD